MRNSLPAWVKSRIQLGAREPGTPGRRAAEGEGTAPAPSRARDLARPTGARTRSSAGLGRTRPPPPQPRRAGIVSRAPAAPCARPAPAARSRSRLAARAGRRPSVGQPDRPALCLPRALEPSGLPSAVPALSSVLLPRGRGGAVSSGARGPAPGAQAASRAAAPPSLERETERGGEAEERKEEADPGRAGVEGVSASQAAAATAPPPRRLGGRGCARRRRRRGRGARGNHLANFCFFQ